MTKFLSGSKKAVTAMASPRNRDLFSAYKDLEIHETRDFKTTQKPTIQKFLELWSSKEIAFEPGADLDDHKKYYARLLELFKALHYSAKEVEEFSILIKAYEMEEEFSYKASYFLNALIQAGRDNEYVIHTGHLDYLLDDFLEENRKKVTVEGSLGGCIAGLNEGEIIVNGNVKSLLSGSGGKITINGNLETLESLDEYGHELYVNGKMPLLEPEYIEMPKGEKVKIYINGKLVFEDGKILGHTFEHEMQEIIGDLDFLERELGIKK